MNTDAVFFPFNLFGSGGAGAGAAMLADAFEELLDDNDNENNPSRSAAYNKKVRFLEFSFDTLKEYNDWAKQASRVVGRSFAKSNFLMWVAGNHLGTMPIYEELGRMQDALVVQFDAHLDVFDLHDTAAHLSHGNFLRHCSRPLPRIVNVGNRDLLQTPKHIDAYFTQTFSTAELAVHENAVIKSLKKLTADAATVFIDLDCDVFDPAYFPAVEHPVPFGISPTFFLRCIQEIWSNRVVGLSVSEFSPARDRHDVCLATLLWLLEYVLLRKYEG